MEPISVWALEDQFRTIRSKLNIKLPPNAAFHSIRRLAVTMVSQFERSDMRVRDFFRWAQARESTIMNMYRRTPSDETDMEILEQHPAVKMWEEVMPNILKKESYQKALCHCV
jgi:hypothetical protein